VLSAGEVFLRRGLFSGIRYRLAGGDSTSPGAVRKVLSPHIDLAFIPKWIVFPQ